MKFSSHSVVFCCLAGLGLLLGGGCAGPSANPATGSSATPRLNQLNEVQQSQKDRALAARDQLFQTLLTALTGAMAESGPANSIQVCQQRAPEIAQQVSQESGIRIGRTSFQLRNSKNQPPSWAAAWVGQRVEEEVLVQLPDEGLGVMTPIRLQATCLLCHGPADQLLPEVKVALAQNYPDDQATGFEVGELRGYFWMEVPGTKPQ